MSDLNDDLMALDMEYRLTLAHRIGCKCAPYFARRREVLIPEVLKEAVRRGEDPVDVFADFARKVHARQCADTDNDFTIGRFVALMAAIHTDGDPS